MKRVDVAHRGSIDFVYSISCTGPCYFELFNNGQYVGGTHYSPPFCALAPVSRCSFCRSTGLLPSFDQRRGREPRLGHVFDFMFVYFGFFFNMYFV